MTMQLVFEKTNILKLFNSCVSLSTSLMCALCIFHWNLIAGNFFTQDCEKKIDCRKKRIQKMYLCHCLKYNFMRQLRRDARLIVCVYCVTWLFPDQYSYFVLWVPCDILQMHTRSGYVVYYWNHPLMLHTFSTALQFKTFSVNSRSCKRKPIS